MRDGWYKVRRLEQSSLLAEYHFVSANRDMTKMSRVDLLKMLGYVFTPVLILEAEDIPQDAIDVLEAALEWQNSSDSKIYLEIQSLLRKLKELVERAEEEVRSG